MPKYEVDYSIDVREDGMLNLIANNQKDAEYQAEQTLEKDFPDAIDFEILDVREVI